MDSSQDLYYHTATDMIERFQQNIGSSASRFLKAVEENQIITCLRIGAGHKPGVFTFQKLIDIVNQ